MNSDDQAVPAVERISVPEGLCTACSATQYCAEHEPVPAVERIGPSERPEYLRDEMALRREIQDKLDVVRHSGDGYMGAQARMQVEECFVQMVREALSAPPVGAPCVACGTTESKDGDWYRLCGNCRWAAPPVGEIERLIAVVMAVPIYRYATDVDTDDVLLPRESVLAVIRAALAGRARPTSETPEA